MDNNNESLKKDILKSLGTVGQIMAIVIFGSVARREDTAESDIDICVVVKEKTHVLNALISNCFLNLEKRYDRNIQLIICDEKFGGIERQFLETILREGEVLCGSIPPIPIQKLQLEPYSIIRYDMKNKSQADKMRISRLLYGKNTRKRYKGKDYLSQKRGLLTKLKGMRAGRSSILLPERESWILEQKLTDLDVRYKKICAWLQKI
jgi:predicted nucleotidyltransferase